MRFEQLKCLVEVANTGSITAAAQKLFISQQAVSVNIKQLEEELQCALLTRIKNGVSLTAKGLETVEFAKKILAEKEAFCNKIQYTDRVENLLIRVCSISAVTNIVLPNVIDRMETKKNTCSLKIMQENTLEGLFEGVKNHQYDIGLMTFNAEELSERFEYYQEELQFELLARDEMVGVLNRKFSQQDAAQISDDDFRARRYSMYNIIPANKYYAVAEKDSVAWSNEAEFHRAMLERNGTLVLMPALAYQFFFSNKKYVALPIENLEIPLIHAAVYRKDAPVYIKKFVSLIRLELYMK